MHNSREFLVLRPFQTSSLYSICIRKAWVGWRGEWGETTASGAPFVAEERVDHHHHHHFSAPDPLLKQLIPRKKWLFCFLLPTLAGNMQFFGEIQ